MMKKIIALCLGLLIIITAASASAEAEWPEGLSPQKPYSGSPEVDFNNSIGYMLFVPITENNTNPGNITLKIYMPRTDIKLGEGLISLFSVETGLVEEIRTDSENIICREMTNEELNALLWGSGCVFEIAVEEILDANQNYYVQMTEGVIVSEIYGTSSVAIEDDKTWKFSTYASNYIDSLTYYSTNENGDIAVEEDAVRPGDYVKLSIVIGDEAASAAIYCDAGSILTSMTYFSASTEPVIEFPVAGEVVWGVTFFDAEGNTLYSMDYITMVNAE